MTEQEILNEKYRKGEVSASDLSFGRRMPFGRYKGQYIYHLLVKHWRYMDWVLHNTSFSLNEIEKWWKSTIDTFIEIRKADNLIFGLVGLMNTAIPLENIDNPHGVIE